MTEVLMTGADGFIGSNVLQYMLNNTGWRFTIICSWRHKGNPLNVPISNRVKVITHDLRGPIPDIGRFDYILNLASESHVDRSIEDPVNFVENNVSSTLQVLEYARQHIPDKFIQFSTDEVYGANEHGEWDVLLPSNPYSASKAAQEAIAIAYAQTYKLPIIITNSNNVIGVNQNPEKYVPKLIEKIKRGQVVEIHTSRGKLGKRFYNPVFNVASALIHILRQSENKPAPGYPIPRYSLYGGKEYNNLEIAELVAGIMGKKLKYKLIDVKTVRPAYDNFYPEVIGELRGLGWHPEHKLKETLAWMINT
jgi:dTDP-glucose 4,6-dehydratase